jgi:cell division protein FtsZ
MNDKNEVKMTFDVPSSAGSIIKVIGVGGGGSNAVNHMYRQGIKGVDFIISNTDSQALDASPVPIKIQLGSTLTEGRGAGSIPDVGKNAAIENIDELKSILSKGTRMVFVTAGMGGGTGTGAAPVIAAAAREMGILTVGIVTHPFAFEGNKRKLQAEDGLSELRKNVDTLLVISNDKLREIHGNLSINAAFAQADNVLATAAKGIAEIITVTGYINVDFADVYTVMKDGGSAIMGSASAEGEERAMESVTRALASPLLNDNKIRGAKHVLINITYGEKEAMMDEISEIIEYVQNEAGSSANVIFGTGLDNTLGDKICVTLIATGFESNQTPEPRVVHKMEEDTVSMKVEHPVGRMNEEPIVISKPISETQYGKPDADEALLLGDMSERPEMQIIVKTISMEPVEEQVIEDEHTRKSRERLENLKNLSTRLKSPSSISDLESIPAYRRRNVKLENVVHSSDSNISRYTLNENSDDKKIEIRPNNSFLHDDVD